MRQNNHKNRTHKQISGYLISIILIVILITLGYFYYKLEDQNKKLNFSENLDSAMVLTNVGKLIVLPTDEDPTIATVADLNALKGQPFFEKAEIGDKVLIYKRAAKAILYRPRENKVIDIGPVFFATSTDYTPTNENDIMK